MSSKYDHIRSIFKHHPPKGDQLEQYDNIRAAALEFATTIVDTTKKSREQSLALTHLENAMMFANAAIARHSD